MGRIDSWLALGGDGPHCSPYLGIGTPLLGEAHEFLDSSTDSQQAELYRGQKYNKVRAFFTGHLNVEVGGEVRPGAYEVDDRATRRFFVMRNPILRGFNAHDDPDLGLMRKLDYVVVNKTRLSYIYDFNE